MIPLGILAAQAPPAPAGAYELISSTILTSDTASVTFSSIPQDFKHLQLRSVMRGVAAGSTFENGRIRFNGDSGANYAEHRLQGNGSSVSSGNSTSQNQIQAIYGTGSASDANIFSPTVLDILDYANTAKNTTTRSAAGRLQTLNNPLVYLTSGLWVDTSAVSQIEIIPLFDDFQTGSRFSLYGIRG